MEAEIAKTRAMTERIYGKDIYTKYEQPASVTPVTSQHEAVTATDKKVETNSHRGTESTEKGAVEKAKGGSPKPEVQASAVAEASAYI